MGILLITGATGVGKTKLLAQSNTPTEGNRVYIIDPLGCNHIEWREPHPDKYDVVAFDHITYLSHAQQQITQARLWCQKYHKPLWLVEQQRSDIESTGFTIDDGALEITLQSKEFQGGIIVTQGDFRQVLSPQETLSFLN